MNKNILELKEILEGQEVIPAPPNSAIREPGHPLYIGNDIILSYTVESYNEDLEKNEQHIHYSYCNRNNPKNWIHMGRLEIYSDFYDKQIPHLLEDPFPEIRKIDGAFLFYCEDKSAPGYTIVMYYSTDWDYKTNEGFWNGGKTTMAPADYGLGKKAVYSYTSFKDPKYYFYEGRDTDEYKDISIGYGGNREVALAYNGDWNIVVPDSPYEFDVFDIIMCHGFYKDGKWHVFLAITYDKLHWKFLTGEPIILPKDAFAEVIPIPLDKWYYLYNDGGQGLCLGTAKGDNEVPIGDEFVFPPGVKGVDYNTILMRYAKIELDKLTIKSGEEKIKQDGYNYIDEIGHYDPFDNI